jgi:hypothetical protein
MFMPKRRIDPATGEPQLTHREQLLVDEFIRNGGNGARAAAAAGYTAARSDQAAYQVLHRDRVQQQIRERIRDSRVSADEIIGTLASHMRGDLTEFFDESGNFSIQVARQKGIGHLLKSISGTICDKPQPPADSDFSTPDPQTLPLGSPQTPSPRPTRRPTFRIQLHSPLQAASILGRMFRIDRHRPCDPLPSEAGQALRDFDPTALLRALIEEQVKEHGLSRDAVTTRLLEVRPEFAKYLDELPPASDPQSDHSSRDTAKLLAALLDAIASLRSTLSPADSASRVVDAYQQIRAVPATTYDDLGGAVGRIMNRLSDTERDNLIRLQLKCLIHQKISEGSLTEAQALDAIRRQAAGLDSNPDPHNDLAYDSAVVEVAITDYLSQSVPQDAGGDFPFQNTIEDASADHLDQSSTEDAASDPPSQSTIEDAFTDHLDQTTAVSDHPNPKAGPTRQAATSNQQPSTCNLQPASCNQSATNFDAFNRKYSRITRDFAIGQLNNRLVEVIHEIMKDRSLTPQQAIDAMWLEARQNTWLSAELIDSCIADFAALHPRLAQAQPPVCAARPQSPPRYYRPVFPESSTAPKIPGPGSESRLQLGPNRGCPAPGSDDNSDDDSDDSEILTSTQLFSSDTRPPPINS